LQHSLGEVRRLPVQYLAGGSCEGYSVFSHDPWSAISTAASLLGDFPSARGRGRLRPMNHKCLPTTGRTAAGQLSPLSYCRARQSRTKCHSCLKSIKMPTLKPAELRLKKAASCHRSFTISRRGWAGLRGVIVSAGPQFRKRLRAGPRPWRRRGDSNCKRGKIR